MAHAGLLEKGYIVETLCPELMLTTLESWFCYIFCLWTASMVSSPQDLISENRGKTTSL